MKKAKFWVSQLIMAVSLVFFLGSPALADKPTDKGGKPTKTCKGKNCPPDSGDGTGDGPGDDSGFCPDGFIYLGLYGICIPV